jgi:hypothetical protein
LSAILGSVVGGSATIATAWLTQRTEGRRAAIDSEIRKREQLYAEFISEGAKLLVEGLERDFESPAHLYPLHAILNRIRLRSSEAVLAAAETAASQIAEQFLDPKVSGEELRKIVLTRPHDPLKQFSEACRLELQQLQTSL